jgi:hypothetical protein
VRPNFASALTFSSPKSRIADLQSAQGKDKGNANYFAPLYMPKLVLNLWIREQWRLHWYPVLIFEFWYGDKEQLLFLCFSRGHFLQLDLNWFINASLGARWAKGSFLKMKEHKLHLMCAAQFSDSIEIISLQAGAIFCPSPKSPFARRQKIRRNRLMFITQCPLQFNPGPTHVLRRSSFANRRHTF